MTRNRRKQVAERSQRLLDQDGLRLGGALADIFGANGRRILNRLVVAQSKLQILACLSGHVRGEPEPQEQVLEADLKPQTLWRLGYLQRLQDGRQQFLDELDGRLEAGRGAGVCKAQSEHFSREPKDCAIDRFWRVKSHGPSCRATAFPGLWNVPSRPHRDRERMVCLLLPDVTLLSASGSAFERRTQSSPMPSAEASMAPQRNAAGAGESGSCGRERCRRRAIIRHGGGARRRTLAASRLLSEMARCTEQECKRAQRYGASLYRHLPIEAWRQSGRNSKRDDTRQ